MNETILVDAVYENGTLKPIKPLNLTEQQVVKISLNPELVTTHPHITKTPGICGGIPAVRGTRIPVKVLANHFLHQNDSIEYILAGFPQLTRAQFYDALSYYYDHQEEIDTDLEADELPAILKQFGLEIDAMGRLYSPK